MIVEYKPAISNDKITVVQNDKLNDHEDIIEITTENFMRSDN